MINSDEGLLLETSLFESLTVANLLLLVFYFPTDAGHSFFETKSFVILLFSRGPLESDTLIKAGGFVYSETYKWQKGTKK